MRYMNLVFAELVSELVHLLCSVLLVVLHTHIRDNTEPQDTVYPQVDCSLDNLE